jgi:undecaprenyl-diphosphatase
MRDKDRTVNLRPIAFLVIFLVLTLQAWCRGAETHPSNPAPQEQRPAAMTLGQAVVLGMVEGVTEYLPVSSTGHLLLAERAMGIGKGAPASPEGANQEKAAADAYAICIQAGAIIAVLGLYVRRVRQMVLGLFGRDAAGLRLVVGLGGAFVPAAVLGFLFDDLIKQYLFGMWPVVAAWFAGGLGILLVDRWQKARSPGGVETQGKSLEELGLKMAVWIGLAQCLAMWPGVSRSLATIVGGLLVGLSLPAAVEFSFLLGVVTLGAATSYDAWKHGQDMLQIFDPASLAAGLVAAFVFAVLSIKWMVGYLSRHGMAIFGYYRLAIAVVVGLLLASSVL